MTYLDDIKNAYDKVKSGSENSENFIKKALQYQNWQHLPLEITDKIKNHTDYDKLDANNDYPIPVDSTLIKNCQSARDDYILNNAYSLRRIKNMINRNSNIKDFETLDSQAVLLALKAKLKSLSMLWCTSKKITFLSEKDIKQWLCKLGLYDYRKLKKGDFFISLHFLNIKCCKPNALDAGLVFYFKQTNDNNYTYNICSGKQGVKEHLSAKPKIVESICISSLLINKYSTIDVADFFSTELKKIQ